MRTEKDNSPLVDEYMKSLQGMQQAETRPFFYSRLRNKMGEKKQVQTVTGFRPAYVICTLFVLLMINFWMITAQKEYKQEKVTTVPSLNGFADAYNFTVSSY